LTDTVTLPSLPGGFTSAWLTQLLRAEGMIPAATQVARVDIAQVGEGVGMMSELCKLLLTYEGDANGAPTSFIAKYPSQNPTNREVAMSFNLYEREVRYFQELDPLTSALSPVAHVAHLQGDNFLLLLQDMTDYRAGDQIKGADLADTQAAIQELAKLHAAFWNNVGDIDWVPHIANSYHADNMVNLFLMGWQGMATNFAEFLSADIIAMGDAFSRALPTLQATMDQPPVTLIHGDFRMENLLYATQPEHHAVAVIDWQGPLLGCGMVDVALMLGQSTITEVRRQHERTLIEQYAGRLGEHGADYDVADAWHHYLLAGLYNWCYVSAVAGTLDSSNARAFAWMSQMVKRQATFTHDHDLFDLLPG